MVGTEWIAALSFWMSGRRSAAELRPRKWCSRLCSHQRPPSSADGALLTELQERIGKGWSGRPDSRRRSPAPHAGALAASYVPIQMAGVMGLAPTSSTVTGSTLVSSYSRPTSWLPELESHQHHPA